MGLLGQLFHNDKKHAQPPTAKQQTCCPLCLNPLVGETLIHIPIIGDKVDAYLGELHKIKITELDLNIIATDFYRHKGCKARHYFFKDFEEKPEYITASARHGLTINNNIYLGIIDHLRWLYLLIRMKTSGDSKNIPGRRVEIGSIHNIIENDNTDVKELFALKSEILQSLSLHEKEADYIKSINEIDSVDKLKDFISDNKYLFDNEGIFPGWLIQGFEQAKVIRIGLAGPRAVGKTTIATQVVHRGGTPEAWEFNTENPSYFIFHPVIRPDDSKDAIDVENKLNQLIKGDIIEPFPATKTIKDGAFTIAVLLDDGQIIHLRDTAGEFSNHADSEKITNLWTKTDVMTFVIDSTEIFTPVKPQVDSGIEAINTICSPKNLENHNNNIKIAIIINKCDLGWNECILSNEKMKALEDVLMIKNIDDLMELNSPDEFFKYVATSKFINIINRLKKYNINYDCFFVLTDPRTLKSRGLARWLNFCKNTP